MFESGDMVFNKLENEVQLVIEVEPSRAFSPPYTDEALTMALDGELLWYPVSFLTTQPENFDES